MSTLIQDITLTSLRNDVYPISELYKVKDLFNRKQNGQLKGRLLYFPHACSLVVLSTNNTKTRLFKYIEYFSTEN